MPVYAIRNAIFRHSQPRLGFPSWDPHSNGSAPSDPSASSGATLNVETIELNYPLIAAVRKPPCSTIRWQPA